MPNWDELTIKEREDYINQDHVNQTEVIFPRGFIECRVVDDYYNRLLDSSYEYTHGRMKILIIKLYNDGKSVDDIAYHLPCSLDLIYKVIRGIKSNE